MLVDIGEKTYFIQADDFVVIPSGQIFKVRYYEKSRGFMGGFDSATILDGGADGGALARFGFLRVWGNPKIILNSKVSDRINALFERIYEESLAQTPDNYILRAYLTAVMVEADAVYRSGEGGQVRHNDTICNRFLDLLFHGEYAQGKVPVSEFASNLNITPNHLNKVVRSVTGKSPSVWIEESLMAKAKLLLRNSSKPLSEIASELGVLDQSYFARRFKLHEGISPSAYRQACKND